MGVTPWRESQRRLEEGRKGHRQAKVEGSKVEDIDAGGKGFRHQVELQFELLMDVLSSAGIKLKM